jgi:hypothetical protein
LETVPAKSATESVVEIPVRATLFSALSTLPYVIMVASILGFEVNYLVRGSLVRTLSQVSTTCSQ